MGSLVKVPETMGTESVGRFVSCAAAEAGGGWPGAGAGFRSGWGCLGFGMTGVGPGRRGILFATYITIPRIEPRPSGSVIWSPLPDGRGSMIWFSLRQGTAFIIVN